MGLLYEYDRETSIKPSDFTLDWLLGDFFASHSDKWMDSRMRYDLLPTETVRTHVWIGKGQKTAVNVLFKYSGTYDNGLPHWKMRVRSASRSSPTKYVELKIGTRHSGVVDVVFMPAAGQSRYIVGEVAFPKWMQRALKSVLVREKGFGGVGVMPNRIGPYAVIGGKVGVLGNVAYAVEAGCWYLRPRDPGYAEGVLGSEEYPTVDDTVTFKHLAWLEEIRQKHGWYTFEMADCPVCYAADRAGYRKIPAGVDYRKHFVDHMDNGENCPVSAVEMLDVMALHYGTFPAFGDSAECNVLQPYE